MPDENRLFSQPGVYWAGHYWQLVLEKNEEAATNATIDCIGKMPGVDVVADVVHPPGML